MATAIDITAMKADGSPRTLVVIATYNEHENLPLLVTEVHHFAPDADLLVVDDSSPDGTGEWCDWHAQRDPQLHCWHRPAKQGLGSATLVGFQYALDHEYEFVITLDADFSHHPRHLPHLRGAMNGIGPDAADVIIGSRYVAGGGIRGWPLVRRCMSWAINIFARWALGLPVRDCSGAYRCYRTAVLRRIDLTQIRATGYGYLEEILWLLKRHGATFVEVPIVFVDRVRGTTKITAGEAFAALCNILRLAAVELGSAIGRAPGPKRKRPVSVTPVK